MTTVKAYAYRLARLALYRGVIPLVSQSGPAQARVMRLLHDLGRHPLFAGNMPNPLIVDGFTLFHEDGRPSFTIRALALGRYEPSVVEVLRTRLQEGMVVLDIGAHLGYHTLLSSRFVGRTGRVWAFEPDPNNRRLLRRNIDQNQMQERVAIVPMAVGSMRGVIALHRADFDSGSSTIIGPGESPNAVQVEVTTLDDWAERNGWPSVNLIKMDIEGAEPDALAGMSELSRRNPDLIMIVECHEMALARGGARPMRLFDGLHELGFDSIKVLDDDRGLARLGPEADPATILKQSRWYPINLCCSHSGS
jgi:FkbM family methyltransferase